MVSAKREPCVTCSTACRLGTEKGGSVRGTKKAGHEALRRERTEKGGCVRGNQERRECGKG